jgi:hypothetical protein
VPFTRIGGLTLTNSEACVLPKLAGGRFSINSPSAKAWRIENVAGSKPISNKKTIVAILHFKSPTTIQIDSPSYLILKPISVWYFNMQYLLEI